MTNVPKNRIQPFPKPSERIFRRRLVNYLDPSLFHFCDEIILILFFLFAHTKPRQIFLYYTTKHAPKTVRASKFTLLIMFFEYLTLNDLHVQTISVFQLVYNFEFHKYKVLVFFLTS